MTDKHDTAVQQKENWLKCPNCGGTEGVYLGVNYDFEINFCCAECGAETGYDANLQWSIADIKRFKGESDDF